MKIALCFIISYDHILNKEQIWRDWIEPNKDIINVYFYYKDITKIKSKWILDHTIPPSCIHETSYYHVIPAYLSVMNFAMNHDKHNEWFCMLTDSCCPIISPKKFRYLFYNYYNKSIFSWGKAYWNIQFNKRANLALLPEEFRLANDPWFVLKRENVFNCISFAKNKGDIMTTICNGGLANESLFAIMLHSSRQLNDTICSNSHVADWHRTASATSPYLFKEGNTTDIQFIEKNIHNKKNNNKKNTHFVMFIRKIAPEFPDDVLRKYIYDYSKDDDNKLIIRDPFIFKKCVLFLRQYSLYFMYIIPIIVLLRYSLYIR